MIAADLKVEHITDLSEFGIIIDTSIPIPPYAKVTATYIANAVSSIANKMITCAENRGNCVALIDHTDNATRSLDPVNTTSVYYSISSVSSSYRIASDVATMFTP